MKKIIFFFTALSLFSCATTKEFKVTSAALNYKSIYESTGIRVTESNSVNFEYTPIATIEASAESGKQNGMYRNAKFTDALEAAAKQAKELGATDIINLRLTPITYVYRDFSSVVGARVSGMAIKRIK